MRHLKKITASPRYFAFTLAEVLITLGIIGIVAALTIPTLVNNYQKAQYVTALKKAYTQFNQALIQLASDNNCVGDLACTNFLGTGTTTEPLGDELIKNFKILKNCKMDSNLDCWPKLTNINFDGSGPSYKVVQGVTYAFVTLDNIAVGIYNFSSCVQTWASLGEVICGQVFFDVNGLKGPNAWGVDTFSFWITKSSNLKPERSIPEENICNRYHPYGRYCAGRVITDGWQMNYYGTLPTSPNY